MVVASSTAVVLNVYDLNEANELLSSMGLGFYHSGVEIGLEERREYAFAPIVGIYDSPPRSVPNALFRGAVNMGYFEGGRERLARAIDALRGRFRPDGYDMVTNNCNNFADALVHELLGAHIPPWINRLAALGSCVACLVPRKLPSPAVDATSHAFGGDGYSVGRAGSSTEQGLDPRAQIRAATLRRLDTGPD